MSESYAMLTEEAQFEQKDHMVIARLPGPQLSGLQMAELINEMSQRVRCDNAQFFVLDMSNVQFMDSSALGGLVGFLLDLEHVRGRIAMACCQANVAFLFKVTRIDAVVSLFDEVEEAVEELL